jgi:hypothetical protein
VSYHTTGGLARHGVVVRWAACGIAGCGGTRARGLGDAGRSKPGRSAGVCHSEGIHGVGHAGIGGNSRLARATCRPGDGVALAIELAAQAVLQQRPAGFSEPIWWSSWALPWRNPQWPDICVGPANRLPRVERRGSDTEKKALADTTFIKFRGLQALNDRLGEPSRRIIWRRPRQSIFSPCRRRPSGSCSSSSC